jgi:hypothetical protein
MVAPERRIALIKPPSTVEGKAAQAIQLMDSVLWAFKGTTRCEWTLAPPESADVIVVAHADTSEQVAEWKASGKLMVVVATDNDADVSSESRVLVYPFRAMEVLALLERLDAEIRSGASLKETSVVTTAAAEGGDPWIFVEALRTLRAVQNSEGWLVGRDGDTPLLWVKTDATGYFVDPSIAQALRRGQIDLSRLSLRRGAQPAAGSFIRSGVELAWFAGFYASDRLAPWLIAEDRFRISRWPNFGLIRPPPSQIRVAATLAKTAVSLSELTARAQVPVDEATRTLNALATCDVLIANDPASPAAAEPARPANIAAPAGGLRAFIRNLRKHLGLGSAA